MCGFIGAVRFDGGPIEAIPVGASTRVRWRGPDAYSERTSKGRVLASARLAIIDLDPEADQPLISADGAWELVFNGEIYNFRDLAVTHRLSAKARRSDSWALLELIGRIGVVEAHQQLRGMYAFAAFEVKSERLWLARDPFGIKPLVWSSIENGAVFGSDPRSLAIWRNYLGLSRGIDRYALTHYLMLGHVPGDATMWADIRRCAPGSVTVLDKGGARVIDWTMPFHSAVVGHPDPDEVEIGIRAAIVRHLIADVEVGAFLSGGLDSSLVVTLASQAAGVPLRTYSVGFDSKSVFDESGMAEAMARTIGSRHQTLRIGSADLRELADGVVEAFPEPHADAAALPMLALSRRACQDVKVVLTGEGGDEMFGGYRRYWALPMARGRLMRLAARGRIGELVSRLGGRRTSQMVSAANSSPAAAYARLLTMSHWNTIIASGGQATTSLVSRALTRYDTPELAQVSPDSLRRLELERHLPESYLEKGDRATMRHGLEARVPLLDLDLARIAFRLSNQQLVKVGRTKILLRQLAERHLPRSVTSAPKRGFSVPLAQWMAGDETARWARQALLGGIGLQLEVFDQTGLSSTLRQVGDFETEEKAETVYRLLMLELWCRQCLESGAL
jgi:asparagine synthase (glutamine-hydrolysing)